MVLLLVAMRFKRIRQPPRHLAAWGPHGANLIAPLLNLVTCSGSLNTLSVNEFRVDRVPERNRSEKRRKLAIS
jgi:hypothetical protein